MGMTLYLLVNGYRLVGEHSQGSGSPGRDCSVFTMIMNAEGIFETSVTYPVFTAIVTRIWLFFCVFI
jgi:hypothetical protein